MHCGETSSLKLNPIHTLDRTILEAIPIPAFVVDDDVRIVDMNSAAAQFCAQDHEDVYKCRGGEALHCVHSKDVPEGCGRASLCQQCVIRNSVNECLEGRTVSRARMSMDFLPESGRKTKEMLITTSPLLNSSERQALLIIEDVTVNDALEQALRRSQKLAVTGRLLATIAHEINNPLESLSNLLYLLRLEPGLGHSAKELVETAEQAVEHLTTITRQALAPHREAKLPVITKLSELLDDVVAVFQRRLESAQIKVRREYQTDGEVSIYPSEFRQVFTNLIANAVDAIGRRGELRLSIEKLPGTEVIAQIRDSGCGIPPENLELIFDPFFTTKGEKGTGLGLWVIKGIVEKVGGKIEVVSSTTGETGTCFSISLPGTYAGTGEQAVDAEESTLS